MAKRKLKKLSKKKASKRKSITRKIPKLPKEAVTLVVLLRSKEGQHLLLEAEIRALIAPTRKEEGCLQYDLHRLSISPASFSSTKSGHRAHITPRTPKHPTSSAGTPAKTPYLPTATSPSGSKSPSPPSSNNKWRKICHPERRSAQSADRSRRISTHRSHPTHVPHFC